MKEWIEHTLIRVFNPSFLHIQDESALHVHHRQGGHTNGTHFRITLYTSLFQGKSRLEMHRLVHEALAPAFKGLPGLPKLHALALNVGISPPTSVATDPPEA